MGAATVLLFTLPQPKAIGMKVKHIFLLLLPLILSSCIKEEGYNVQRKNLVEGVYASGEVLPVGLYEVPSKVSGVVDTIYVVAGQEVDAGAPLFRIRNQTNQFNLGTARNLYKLAQDKAAEQSDLLISLRQKTESAYQTYQQDSLDAERYKRLRAKEVGSEQTYEKAVLRCENSERNYIIARSNLRETEKQIQTELKNAKNQYLAQKSLLSDYTVLAETSGKVYDVLPRQGELVSSSGPVIHLGAADQFEVEIRVDETDVVLVRERQEVLYALDALEHVVFRGIVKKIFPKINPTDRTAKVVASINPDGHDFYMGMSLEANVIVQKKDSVLVIPVEYLTPEGTVLLDRAGEEESVAVKTGIRDLEYVEVLSGLSVGDHLLKP